MNSIKKFLSEVQEITTLLGRSIRGLWKGPRYWREIVTQMDRIGVGSLRDHVAERDFLQAAF